MNASIRLPFGYNIGTQPALINALKCFARKLLTRPAFALRWHPAHRLGRYDGGLAELLAAALAVAALAWFAGPQ